GLFCLAGHAMPKRLKGGLASEQADKGQKPVGRMGGFERRSARCRRRPAIDRLLLNVVGLGRHARKMGPTPRMKIAAEFNVLCLPPPGRRRARRSRWPAASESVGSYRCEGLPTYEALQPPPAALAPAAPSRRGGASLPRSAA